MFYNESLPKCAGLANSVSESAAAVPGEASAQQSADGSPFVHSSVSQLSREIFRFRH